MLYRMVWDHELETKFLIVWSLPTFVRSSYLAQFGLLATNNFHELNTVIFFERTVEMKSNVAPANGILMPATRREVIPGIPVKSSTIMDSNERVIA
jgi:hypothetical protein